MIEQKILISSFNKSLPSGAVWYHSWVVGAKVDNSQDLVLVCIVLYKSTKYVGQMPSRLLIISAPSGFLAG